ncbi:MAG: hypothetical protein JXB24_08595 [Bacteroidales bacterium]|nr:hypothetical protein [Bacteroidales bacterium]
MNKYILLPFLPFLFFCFALCACEKDEISDPSRQIVYFAYEYINYAWGYQHTGWLIDSAGNLNAYNLPDEWQPGNEEGISYKDLKFNLSQTDSVIATIDPAVLTLKVQLIGEAKDGIITPAIHAACDAGTSALYAYYYDVEKQLYRIVFLARSGDFESHNTSPAAVELTEWLKQFGVFWLD